MDRIACRCGWTVYPGLDCDFCSTPAHEVIEHAAVVAELRDVVGLRLA